jgi:HSP20 family protein
MNLIPRDNITDFSRIFDDFFPSSRSFADNGKAFFAPQVDISAQDDHYLIKADLPGVKKDDIHVTLEDGLLTLEAERSEEKTEESQGKVIRKERRSGKFARSFSVGRDITVEDIAGTFEDGVLTIKVPKASQQAAVSKRVEIS